MHSLELAHVPAPLDVLKDVLLLPQTWIIQYINLLAGNVGLVILAGQFLKVRRDEHSV